MRFNIQDEIGMLQVESDEDAYPYALKEEDKLKRRHEGDFRGKEEE